MKDDSNEIITLDLPESQQYITELAWSGAIVNVSDNRIILQPDYLLDISSIAACFNERGPHPAHYIYNLVFPSEPSAYNLLGNTVNLFFDDRVEDSNRSYKECLQKTFHDDAIQFLSVDEEQLRNVYFNNIADQYSNVVNVIDYQLPEQTPAMNKEYGMLEPSFICPELGLSGRMDYLELHNVNGNKEASIIELKSGKRDDYRRTSKVKHIVQTLLYAEALHYSLNIEYKNIHNYLLYNKYPLLSAEFRNEKLIEQALVIRNQVIWYLHILTEGKGDFLFTPEFVESMYTPGDKLWDVYTKPKILENVNTIYQAKPILKEWFYKQLGFILKEEELSRLGEPGDTFNDRSISNIWRYNYSSKVADGKIISPLTVNEILLNDNEVTGIDFKIEKSEDFTSHDFRLGDSVIVYPIINLETKANERIIIHANVTTIDDSKIIVELRHSERPFQFDDIKNGKFACEHDAINSGLGTACKAPFRMLKADERWQKLLIEEEIPEVNDYDTTKDSYVDGIVNKMMNTKDYYLLVGPPGTGKTSVILKKIVSRLYSETKENILLLSFTHRAVDEICETLENIIEEDNAFMDYCRLGSDFDCSNDKFKEHLLSNCIDSCKKRSELLERIESMRLFVSTTSRLNISHSLLDLKKFDTIIVDESSQLLDYQFIELLTHAKRFILIGDHKQLPAVTLQNTEPSLFQRLYIKNEKDNPSVVGLLVNQGRMHPDIAKFANEMFYDNRLDIIPLPHQEEKESILPRYEFIDVKPIAHNLKDVSIKCNIDEAIEVGNLVQEIVDIYHFNGIEFNEKTLGIIVPYRNQISAIRKEISKHNIEEIKFINIDTVERYQGSQRDIIIFSATVSTESQLAQLSAPININNVLVDRKLNVIITRARKHIYIIGNKELLSKNQIYRALIEKMTDKN